MNSRRDFLKKASLAIGSFYIVPRHVLGKGYLAPSDKLNVAGVGCSGKGWVDINGAWDNGKENIVALCDVDEKLAEAARKKFPNAPFYKDFREMFDKQKDIDAVTVTTPDHTHYVVAMAAMQRNKHVYVQKPLAHNIYECRKMTEAAHQYKVVTQMGNQGASGDGVRLFTEWYRAGLIGEVSQVHVWTNRPVWPQGIAKPTNHPPVPGHLDWDLWLGPAQWEEYSPAYHPFNWRGWTAYGTGALGDMGCHMMDPPYRALELGYPSEVECSVSNVWTDFFKQGYFPDSFPAASVIHLKFPRSGKPDVKMTWYDGGILPQRPDQIPPDVELGDPNGGVLMIGKKGVLMCGLYGMNPTLWPQNLMEKAKKIKQTIPRVVNADREGHYQQWLAACKSGYDSGQWKGLSSHFDYAGPMSESVLMGNLAIRSYFYRETAQKKSWLKDHDYPGRRKLLWDGQNMKITNFDDANQFVKRDYRTGWTL
jgi:Oxidoreductase family, NAD-binding Rossmann fold/Oxidoreductase family, C-terminal alpha/beta domain